MSDQQPKVDSTSAQRPDGSWVTSVTITDPTPAGEVHPAVPVVPAADPTGTPRPAGEVAAVVGPGVLVVTPPDTGTPPGSFSNEPPSSPATPTGVVPGTPAPAPQPEPAKELALGTVVTHTYTASGTDQELSQTGIVVAKVAVDDGKGGTVPNYVVGWFAQLSDPIPGDALTEAD